MNFFPARRFETFQNFFPYFHETVPIPDTFPVIVG